MLLRYTQDNGFPNPKFYVDDGVSGTAFERDGFKAMMSDIEAGKVGIYYRFSIAVSTAIADNRNYGKKGKAA